MQLIDGIIILSAEWFCLSMIAKMINLKLDKKREREVCKFYLEVELPFIILLTKEHYGLKML